MGSSSTAGSGTASSTSSPRLTAASPQTGRSAPSRSRCGPEADLTPYGIADLISSFLEALDLNDVTIVGNDSGGAMSQVLVTRNPERIGRLVLTNCDTHENFPPGIFKAMPQVAALPGGMAMLAAPFRVGALARAAFRPFTKDPIPAELIESWMRPGLDDPGIRRRRPRRSRSGWTSATRSRRPRSCATPTSRCCSPGRAATGSSRSAYAERLAAEARDARIVEIPDAKTFVPVDQPQRVAEEIAAFAPPV